MRRTFFRGFSVAVDELMLFGSALLRKKLAFHDTADGPPPTADALIEEVEAARPEIDWPTNRPLSRRRLRVGLPSMGLETFLDFIPATRPNPDTLLVYHHGLGEIPHDAVAMVIRRRGLLAERADMVLLKAPHHESPFAVTERFLANRNFFARVLATQAGTAKEVARAIGDRYRHRVMAGVSMGGLITLAEACYDPCFDLGIPVVAGPVLHDVLLRSSFRRTVAGGFRRRESRAPWLRMMDMDPHLEGRMSPPLRPLLARSDRLFRLRVQREAYARIPCAKVREFEGGHATGVLRMGRVARHIVDAIREVRWGPAPASSSPGIPSPASVLPLATA